MQQELPDTIANRYRVLGRLGAGGIGVVYEAFDPVLNKTVAVKVLLQLSDDLKLRFHQEAKAAGKLRHQNIISVLDFGLTKDQQPYMVMERVKGSTLARRIRGSGGMSLAEALPVVLQICDGLEHAHKNGVLHRDIKPGNVMLENTEEEEPRAIIVDFGLAKLWSSDQSLTSSGQLIGSPYYMSPEQVGGKELDGRSDLYSLGCLIFELLTGRPPFREESAHATMAMHLNQPPPSLSSANGEVFDPALEALIAKCLAKKKEERYESIEAFRTELINYYQTIDTKYSDSPKEDAEGTTASTKPKISRKNLLLVVGACALVCGTLVLNIVIKSQKEDSFNDYKVAVQSQERPEVAMKDYRNIADLMASSADGRSVEALKKASKEKSMIRDNRYRIDRALSNQFASEVELFGSVLTDDDFNRLSEMPNLKIFIWSHARKVPVQGFAKLTKRKNLKELNLRDSVISDDILREIGKMTALESLNLNEAQGFTNKGLSYLPNNKRLTSLVLESFTGLNNEGLSYVSKLKELDTLNIDRTKGYDSSGFAQLTKLKKLRNLVMTLYMVPPEEVKKRYETVKALPSLQMLGLRNINFSNIGVLAGHPKLSYLSARAADFKDDDVTPILSLNIKSLDVFRGPVNVKAMRVFGASKLESISFHDCALESEGILALKNCKRLKRLQFKYCRVAPEAISTLRKTLKHCQIDVEEHPL